MNSHYSLVLTFTQFTHCWHFISRQNCSICRPSTDIIWVFFSNKIRIAPNSLARLATKIFFTFWLQNTALWMVNNLPTNKTGYVFTFFRTFVLTNKWAIFSTTIFNPRWFCIERFFTKFTFYNHKIIIHQCGIQNNLWITQESFLSPIYSLATPLLYHFYGS